MYVIRNAWEIFLQDYKRQKKYIKKINTKIFFQIYNLKVYLDSVCQEINKLISFCRKHYYMY